MLADVFGNFQKMCLEVYELDPDLFLTAVGLGRQAALEKNKVDLDLLTDVSMLLMDRKRYQRKNMLRYLSICKF